MLVSRCAARSRCACAARNRSSYMEEVCGSSGMPLKRRTPAAQAIPSDVLRWGSGGNRLVTVATWFGSLEYILFHAQRRSEGECLALPEMSKQDKVVNALRHQHGQLYARRMNPRFAPSHKLSGPRGCDRPARRPCSPASESAQAMRWMHSSEPPTHPLSPSAIHHPFTTRSRAPSPSIQPTPVAKPPTTHRCPRNHLRAESELAVLAVFALWRRSSDSRGIERGDLSSRGSDELDVANRHPANAFLARYSCRNAYPRRPNL
uniref:Uncharacterized protein n=1 Tax=Mycena chlorophos TaxID=658473 RepID=A0ABQ0M1G0_MYCCL|nr:predicted protein [Mycena chlorophos]